MKNLLKFILAMTLASPMAFAAMPTPETPDPDQEKEEEQDVDSRYKNTNLFEMMAKTFKDELIKQMAKKIAEKTATEAVQSIAGKESDGYSKSVSEKIGWGFAAWGFYKNARSYHRAQSESERYHAAVDASSSAISVIPVLGTTLSLIMTGHNIASQMIGSWYTKDALKETMHTQLEAFKIYNQILKNERRIAKAEERALTKLFSEFLLAEKLSMESLKSYQKNCATLGALNNFNTSDLQTLMKPYDDCVENALNVVSSHELFVSTFYDLIKFPASHILTEKFLDVKAGNSKEKLNANLNKSLADLMTLRMSMDKRLEEYNQQKATMIKTAIDQSNEIQSGRHDLICRQIMMEIGKTIFEAAKDKGRLGPRRLLAAIQDFRFNRDQFCEGVQFGNYTGAMERLNHLVDSYERTRLK